MKKILLTLLALCFHTATAFAQPTGGGPIGGTQPGVGGGAPTDAQYLTAAANATLTNEVVVPANGVTFITAGNYGNMRAALGTAIGIDVQGYSANLSQLGAIAYSPDILSFLASANDAAARVDLGLQIGVNVQAYDSDLTIYGGITPSANVQSLLGAANYAAMRTQLSLVPGTDIQAYSAILLDIADGTIATNLVNTANPWATNEGGTGTDLSANTGIWGSNAGAFIDIDTAEELLDYAMPDQSAVTGLFGFDAGTFDPISTSADLAGQISNETGSSPSALLVYNTSPAFVTSMTLDNGFVFQPAAGTNGHTVNFQMYGSGGLTTIITLTNDTGDAKPNISFNNCDLSLPSGLDLADGNVTSGADIDADSVTPDAATLLIGDADEETHIQADGLPDGDDTYSCGMVVWLTAGNAVKQWDLVMMQADGKVDMANATGVPIGYAVEESNDGWPAADTESIGVCLIGSGGVIRNDGWTGHTAGEIVYVVDAGGTDGLFDPADEIDLEDGDHWTAVGVMQEEDIVIFPVPAWTTDDGT